VVSHARTLFEQGRLDDAIAELNQAVKSHPTDNAQRIFLFELLCLQGDLERAVKQLDVLATQSTDPGVALAVQGYQGLLTAESARRAVIEGDQLPKFILAPPAHVERYVVLLKKLKTGTADEVGALLDEAEEATPPIAGERGGRPFAAFRDADDRFAAVLEVFFGGEYLWVPLEQVRQLDVAAPAKLRDTIWIRAKLQVEGQPTGDVFLPAAYPGSHSDQNAMVRLGRITEWTALHERMVVGRGQRVFLVDDDEVALLELGSVTFARAAAGA
jgi:type VI secretion system protein ImpE